jgi:hypothetical protein
VIFNRENGLICFIHVVLSDEYKVSSSSSNRRGGTAAKSVVVVVVVVVVAVVVDCKHNSESFHNVP